MPANNTASMKAPPTNPTDGFRQAGHTFLKGAGKEGIEKTTDIKKPLM